VPEKSEYKKDKILTGGSGVPEKSEYKKDNEDKAENV